MDVGPGGSRTHLREYGKDGKDLIEGLSSTRGYLSGWSETNPKLWG